jgi:hypothetical protein
MKVPTIPTQTPTELISKIILIMNSILKRMNLTVFSELKMIVEIVMVVAIETTIWTKASIRLKKMKMRVLMLMTLILAHRTMAAQKDHLIAVLLYREYKR